MGVTDELGVGGALVLLLAVSIAGCVLQRPAKPAPPFAAVVGPLIIAHRGGSLEAPENTLGAVRHGIASGADWQEIDVTLSRDDVVVVIHDDTLERTAGVPGRVEELTAAQLAAIVVGNPRWSESGLGRLQGLGVAPPAFGPEWAGERVPTLAEVLALEGGRLMIELKTTERRRTLVEKTLEAVYRAGAADRVALGSFDAELLQLVALRDPSLPLVAIVEDLAGVEAMQGLTPTVIAVAADRAAEVLPHLSGSTAVWAWTAYTVDQAVALRDLGVHGIITDAPAAVVGALRAEIDPYVRPTTP